VGKTAITHLPRNTAITTNLEAGTSLTDTRGAYGFEHDTATNVYLRGGLWVKPMLVASGWKDMDAYFCWWEGNDADIPVELKQLGGSAAAAAAVVFVGVLHILLPASIGPLPPKWQLSLLNNCWNCFP